jgi:hypothetical protein
MFRQAGDNRQARFTRGAVPQRVHHGGTPPATYYDRLTGKSGLSLGQVNELGFDPNDSWLNPNEMIGGLTEVERQSRQKMHDAMERSAQANANTPAPQPVTDGSTMMSRPDINRGGQMQPQIGRQLRAVRPHIQTDVPKDLAQAVRRTHPQPGSGFDMPPPPAPLAMVGDPVDVGFSSGVTVPQPTMSQAQKRAQYFQQQRMNRAGYSTGGITDLPVDRRQNGGKTGDSGSKTRMSELMDQGFSYDEALNAAILEKQGARPVASGESASSYEQSQADRQRRFNEIQTLARQEMLRRINEVEGHVPGVQRGFLETTLMNEIQQDYDKYPRGEYVFRRDRTE